jgi:hypothetical protein
MGVSASCATEMASPASEYYRRCVVYCQRSTDCPCVLISSWHGLGMACCKAVSRHQQRGKECTAVFACSLALLGMRKHR